MSSHDEVKVSAASLEGEQVSAASLEGEQVSAASLVEGEQLSMVSPKGE